MVEKSRLKRGLTKKWPSFIILMKIKPRPSKKNKVLKTMTKKNQNQIKRYLKNLTIKMISQISKSLRRNWKKKLKKKNQRRNPSHLRNQSFLKDLSNGLKNQVNQKNFRTKNKILISGTNNIIMKKIKLSKTATHLQDLLWSIMTGKTFQLKISWYFWILWLKLHPMSSKWLSIHPNLESIKWKLSKKKVPKISGMKMPRKAKKKNL